MTDLGLLIDNVECQATGGGTFERNNPVTGELATRAAAATVDDALRAADAAAAAFPGWSKTSPGARRKILLAAADRLQARTDDFIAAMGAETGSTAGWAGFNVMLAADMLREAAALTTQITGEIIPSNRPGSTAYGVRQAAGVVLSIAPWNAPVIWAYARWRPRWPAAIPWCSNPARSARAPIVSSPMPCSRPGCRPACSMSSPTPPRMPPCWSRR